MNKFQQILHLPCLKSKYLKKYGKVSLSICMSRSSCFCSSWKKAGTETPQRLWQRLSPWSQAPPGSQAATSLLLSTSSPLSCRCRGGFAGLCFSPSETSKWLRINVFSPPRTCTLSPIRILAGLHLFLAQLITYRATSLGGQPWLWYPHYVFIVGILIPHRLFSFQLYA